MGQTPCRPFAREESGGKWTRIHHTLSPSNMLVQPVDFTVNLFTPFGNTTLNLVNLAFGEHMS